MRQETRDKRQDVWIVILTVVLFVLIVVPVFVSSAEETPKGVVLLEPSIPLRGIEGGVVEPGQLGVYLNGLYLLGIGIASGLAVVYITIGGIEYMVSASAGKKEEGRKKIIAAVGGLLLALASFVILNTINPELLQFNLQQAISNLASRYEPQFANKGDVWPPQEPCPEGAAEDDPCRIDLNDQDIRDNLKIATNDRVTINKRDCTFVKDSDCTSLWGINETNFYAAMVGIVGKSNCDFLITSGTEYWLHGNRSPSIDANNTKHKPGNVVIDMRDDICIRNYILGNTGENTQSTANLSCFQIIERDGVPYKWEAGRCEGSSENHWHVEIYLKNP